MKKSFVNKYFDDLDAKERKEIYKTARINILNDPELIILMCSTPDEDGMRFKYVPFEFTIRDIIDPELRSDVCNVEYEIRNIISYK